MKVRLVPCGSPVNESERCAFNHLKSRLNSVPGDGEWLLLTNLSFSPGDASQSAEIDVVAIGPPGVRVVEVKHWRERWIDHHRAVVEREAEKVTQKAKRIGARLRGVCSEVGRVDGAFLVTETTSIVNGLAGRKVRNIPLCRLEDWQEAIGFYGPRVLSREQVRELGEALEPAVPIAVSGSVRTLGGFDSLELQTPADQRFHRVFKGVLARSRDPMVVHLYDLSAEGEDLEARARREWEALYSLTKYAWTPRIRDSFQEVRDYAGEMWFFSIDDPAAPALAERRHDKAWNSAARLGFALEAVRALRQLHAQSGNREPMLHRNLTPETILVKGDRLPLLTGFELARIPEDETVARAQLASGDWSHVVAPEVRDSGLGAADARSDSYSLCKCLSLLFDERQDPISREALERVSVGALEDPRERWSLTEIEDWLEDLADETGGASVTPAWDGRTVGEVVQFRGSGYRIDARLGAGGVGRAFRVARVDPATGEETGPYVGKVVRDRAMGERVLESHRLVRPFLGRHQGLAAIFEVASAWQPDSLAVLMAWAEGHPLSELVGKFPPSSSGQPESAEELAIRWLREACDALGVLHSQGLVHGDVTPGNLIVSGGSLVVTDFDLVTRAGARPVSPGTPMYCSPSRRRREPSRPSDDIYDLAAGMFRAVFDARPFPAAHSETGERGLNWGAADRSAFPALAAFLDKATHPVAERRFQDARQALLALKALGIRRAGGGGERRPPEPEPGFALECFDEKWVAVMRELSSTDQLDLQPGADVMGSPSEGVVGEYLARVVQGREVTFLVDLDADGAADVVRALRKQGRRVLELRLPRSAAEILGALAALQGNPPDRHQRGGGRSGGQDSGAAQGLDYASARDRLARWLRRQLIGPASTGQDSWLNVSPLERYPVGVLHPVEADAAIADSESSHDPSVASEGAFESSEDEVLEIGEGREATLAQPVRQRHYVPPCAVGFSCCVKGPARLRITARATRYRVAGERDALGKFLKREYKREPPMEGELVWEGGSDLDCPVDPRFGVSVRSRGHAGSSILTVTLYNRQNPDPNRPGFDRVARLVESALFEAELECHVEAGELIQYPRVDQSLLSEEEQEIELQYREKGIFAVGHGAAADWSVDGSGPARIWTEFLPAVEVRRVKADVGGQEKATLEFEFLAAGPAQSVIGALRRFVAGYRRWIADQEAAAFSVADRPAADRICRRMAVALERMQRGVELLDRDPSARKSFRIANQAMLDQFRQRDRVLGKKSASYRWRPFQLAFLLAVLQPTADSEDDFRDVVDLIWFPTGGGKTEAYLGLIAFLIAWRRLVHGAAGAGTTTLMRYTLRLLTKQQFERAARVIFALERIRRRCPADLPGPPVTAGIWVGMATSPNRFEEALECAQGMAAGQPPPNGLVLAECPWCGSGFSTESYRATEGSFHFLCLNDRCDFGGREHEPLPCNVVDEALYNAPPSLLIGTIDKFARLAWEQRAAAFFGRGSFRPPELVIQDELHLITGPLGSIAGLYEAGLDTLLRVRGARPKYVASTATIRMAEAQVRRLYGRRVSVFPPPGLSCDDCYFARVDMASPGRMYVGYMAPTLRKSACLAPLAAALLAAPAILFEDQEDREALLEAWWTQIVYHSSLTSVGDSHTSYISEVRDWFRAIRKENKDKGSGESTDAAASDGREAGRSDGLRIEQLTSRHSALQNAATFARLERRRDEPDYLDVVLATNMISVGLDVSRLALMIVNGQPYTTADYIQASSRVGRSEVPGVVVANYYRHQARSQFHYENFRPYHESFYRFVEPTSVTPYTYEVRMRALHAALVIAVRHSCDELRDNDGAARFNPGSERIREVIETLKSRCAAAAGPAADQTVAHIESLVESWHAEAQRCNVFKRGLKYDAKRDRAYETLLIDFSGKRQGLWRTLHSMRNVERTAVLEER